MYHNTSFVKHTLILCYILLVNTNSWAQDVYISGKVNQNVDPARYDKIKGSPYLYNVWHRAQIISANGTIYNEQAINYNGLTQQLELKENGKTTPLPRNSFIKVLVEVGGDSITEVFLRRIHPDFGDKLVCIAYDGDRIKLIKIFTVRLEESGAQTPIYPTEFEKFVNQTEYYLMIDGNLSSITLKKKKVVKVLGHSADIEQFTKKNNLNLKKEGELIQLLKYYETNLIQQIW